MVTYLKVTLSHFKIKVCAPLNENSRHMLDMGVDVGCTDLALGMRVGRVYHMLYLELKTKDGDLHESQIDWNKEFDEHYASDNCVRDVAYGYLHGVDIINRWIERLTKDDENRT